MTSETAIVFARGEEQLVGILHEPTSAPHEVGVLVVVGGPQYRAGSHRQFVLLARELCRAGYRVLRFDYTGMGDSTGTPRTFESVDEDIRVAVDTLVAHEPRLRRVVIFGLCDAASAALMYCCSDSRIAGLALANPWVRTDSGAAQTVLKHYYGTRLLQRSFWTKLFTGEFRALQSLRSLFGSVRSAAAARAGSGPPATHFVQRMLQGLRQFRPPVLIELSDRDLVAREFEDLCKASSEWARCSGAAHVRTIHLRDADHTFSTSRALNESMEHIRNWLQTIR